MVALAAANQKIVATNKARNLVFFEDNDLCYNYKTGQWTRVPAYNGISYYSVNNKSISIGLVRRSSGSVDLQGGGGVAQDATITTGAFNLNEGGRAVVNGVRPLVNGGTITIKVGEQDYIGDTVAWSGSTSLNSRTRYANLRSEGRWHRAEFTITGGFTTAMGFDVDFTPQGRV